MTRTAKDRLVARQFDSARGFPLAFVGDCPRALARVIYLPSVQWRPEIVTDSGNIVPLVFFEPSKRGLHDFRQVSDRLIRRLPVTHLADMPRCLVESLFRNKRERSE